MGLCKCPKKKVTTLFCFEHTVNVCEHCLVTDHPRCVVQSYLRWLQDSDYDPSCRLCGKSLSDESCGDCIRLLCYDVYHWQCLDAYERSMPPNTAPAGFTCPTCTSPIFPPPNSSSPVAQKLVELFSTANWARSGLGLPMIEEANQHNGAVLSETMKTPPQKKQQQQHQQQHQQQQHSQLHHHHHHQHQQQFTNNPNPSNFAPDQPNLYARGIEKSDFLSGPPTSSRSEDSDVDKYKRRPLLQTLSRWLKNNLGSQRHQASAKNNKVKRYSIIIFLFLATFGTLLLLLQRAGRMVVDDDPLLDPMANPNIRVQSD